MLALVNKIIPFSSVDGPGNRTAIFLQGCNFNCQYCHNPETIKVCVHCGACLEYCPTGALYREDGKIQYDHTKCTFCDSCFKHCPHSSSPRIRLMTAQDVMREASRNMPFIRGITVSGGECTQQAEFLRELLTLAKEKGLDTLLDSNGSYDFSLDEKLLSVTDGVMLDIKVWDPQEHLHVVGCPNDTVLKNLQYLAACGKLEEVRTVIVPGLFDTEGTVRQVSRVLAPHLSKRSIRYKIIAYRPMGVRGEYQSLRSPTQEELQVHAAIAKAEGMADIVVI